MASGKITSHDRYVAALDPDERTLVTLRDELYNGSWPQMLGDLKDLRSFLDTALDLQQHDLGFDDGISRVVGRVNDVYQLGELLDDLLQGRGIP